MTDWDSRIDDAVEVLEALRFDLENEGMDAASNEIYESLDHLRNSTDLLEREFEITFYRSVQFSVTLTAKDEETATAKFDDGEYSSWMETQMDEGDIIRDDHNFPVEVNLA
jgi:hypothetical protein